MTRSTVQASTSLVGGGGILVHEGAVAALQQVRVEGNVAADDGGGVKVVDASMEIRGSSFAGNAATSGTLQIMRASPLVLVDRVRHLSCVVQ